jgi:hypothetical protein
MGGGWLITGCWLILTWHYIIIHLYPSMALPYHLVAGLCYLKLLNVQRPVNTSKRGLKHSGELQVFTQRWEVTRYHWNMLETRSLHLFLTVGLTLHFVQFQGLTQASFGCKVDMLCSSRKGPRINQGFTIHKTMSSCLGVCMRNYVKTLQFRPISLKAQVERPRDH